MLASLHVTTNFILQHKSKTLQRNISISIGHRNTGQGNQIPQFRRNCGSVATTYHTYPPLKKSRCDVDSNLDNGNAHDQTATKSRI